MSTFRIGIYNAHREPAGQAQALVSIPNTTKKKKERIQLGVVVYDHNP